MDLMDMYHIEQLAEDGLTQTDIAEKTGYAISTVGRVLNGDSGKKQREIADRWEYFSSQTDSQPEGREYSDPTFDTVALMEEYGSEVVEEFL